MSSARRYRKALKVIQQRRLQDETMTRFGWLVGGVLVVELAVFAWVTGLLRPLG